MQKVKKIKPKIGFVGESREDILDDLKFATKNKFDYYEISPRGENFNFKLETIRQARKISKNNNISLILHVPYFLPIASLISEISVASLKFLKKEIILANRLGAKEITVHSSGKEMPKIKTTIERNFEVLMGNLRKAVKFGKKYKIKIGLENSWTSERLCRKAEDLLKVVNSVKGLGITFDAGHANAIGSNSLEYFGKIKNRILNIHVSDNDGKSDQHAVIGEGNINYKALLMRIKKSGYYGPFILEVFPHKNVLECRERFLNLWNQV